MVIDPLSYVNDLLTKKNNYLQPSDMYTSFNVVYRKSQLYITPIQNTHKAKP